MRIAVVSDIHGNVPALDALVISLKRAAPDVVLCLGDVMAVGPQPREALARLRDLAWPTVMGNTDDWMLRPTTNPDNSASGRIIEEIELWNAAQLTDEDRAYIRTFQPTLTLPLSSDEHLLCYHGSPRSYHDPIEATTPPDQLDAWLEGTTARFLAGGHTHTRLIRQHGDRLILNPGSVGLPQIITTGAAYNPAWVEYALLDWEQGRMSITLACEPFDLEALLSAARSSGMPHAEVYCADWRPV